MNALRTFGIAVYGSGFTYTFGETFVDTIFVHTIATVQKERLQNPSNTRISSLVEGVGLFSW
jgi:hypothetical protein